MIQNQNYEIKEIYQDTYSTYRFELSLQHRFPQCISHAGTRVSVLYNFKPQFCMTHE